MYTIKQAANLLGIKVRTVREWIRSGKLKANKEANGRWNIPVSEIERLNNANKD